MGKIYITDELLRTRFGEWEKIKQRVERNGGGPVGDEVNGKSI